MTAGRRILVALLFSGLAHGVVLTTGTATLPSQPEAVEAGRLSVHLQGGMQTATLPEQKTTPAAEPKSQGDDPKPAKEPESPPKATAEPSPKADSVDGIQRAPKKQPAETAKQPTVREIEQIAAAGRPEENESEAPQNKAPLSAADVKKALQASLEDELAKHLHYPYLARRRGWEGTVVLRLRFDDQEQIDATEIVKSSGHRVLDQAALNAIAKARISQVTSRLGGAELQLDLPVIYRLKDG